MVRRYNSQERGSSPEINWDHPLAKGLEICIEFLEHTGFTALDLVHKIRGIGGAGLNYPYYVPRGMECRVGSSALYTFTGIPDAKLLLGLTIVCRGGVYSAGGFHDFGCKHLGGGGSNAPFNFRTDSGTPVRLVCVRSDGGGSVQVDDGPPLVIRKTHSMVYVDPRPNTSRNREFWLDGIKTTTLGAASSASVTGSGADLRIGRRADSFTQLAGFCQYFRVWSRGLTGVEIKWLHEEPYALFNFPVKRSYLVLSGDSGILAASASDSLNNWLDLGSASLGLDTELRVEAFDSMFYNIFDELTYGSSLTGITSSDVMSMSDSAVLSASGLSFALSFGDSLSFADSISLSLLSNRSFADSMSMSDSLLMSSNMLLGVSDSLNFWSDLGLSSGPAINLGQAVSDTMNFWSDSISGLSSTAETNYLRQYLNDVIN